MPKVDGIEWKFRTLISSPPVPSMAESGKCWGHGEREARKNKINKLVNSPTQSLDEEVRILIRKGPVSEESSLRKLEEVYGSTSSWKTIEDGGILKIPLQEFRMIHPPQPDLASGQIDFGKAQGERGTKIENYTVAQTSENLNALVLHKYNEAKENAKAEGKLEVESEKPASAEASRVPQFMAVKAWQDGGPQNSSPSDTFSQPESNKCPEGPWPEDPLW